MPSGWVPTTTEKVAPVVMSCAGVWSVKVRVSLPEVATSSGGKAAPSRVSLKLRVTKMVVSSLALVRLGRGLVWSPR